MIKMGMADDFMSSFFEHYPQARDGKLSMEELGRLLAEFQRQENNRPLRDFDGLNPAQMDILLRAPLSDNCILQFNKSMDEHLDGCRFLNFQSSCSPKSAAQAD